MYIISPDFVTMDAAAPVHTCTSSRAPSPSGGRWNLWLWTKKRKPLLLLHRLHQFDVFAVFTGDTWVWNVIPVRRVKFILCFQDLLKQLGIVFIVKGRVSTQPERKRWDIFNTRKQLPWAVLGPEPLTRCKKWLLSTSSPPLCCMASAREPRELRDTHKQGKRKSKGTEQRLA